MYKFKKLKMSKLSIQNIYNNLNILDNKTKDYQYYLANEYKSFKELVEYMIKLSKEVEYILDEINENIDENNKNIDRS